MKTDFAPSTVHSLKKLTSFIALAICALMNFSGCTTLTAEFASNRFESPETNGTEKRFGAGAYIYSGHRGDITNDASVRPPNFSKPGLDDNTLAGISGSFGLVERLDLSVRTQYGSSPSLFVAKLQLLGPTMSEAKEGDMSLAITGAIGGGKSTKSGDQSGLFGPGGHRWSGSVESKTTEAAVILGQRLTDRILIYGGGFYSNSTVNTNIDQQESDDHSSPAASYSSSTGAFQRGANLGFQINGGGGYLIIEGVYSDMQLGAVKHSLFNAGVGGGVNF